MAATKKFPADWDGLPSALVNICSLALSTRISGMRMKLPFLKLADKVVEKIFPPLPNPLKVLK